MNEKETKHIIDNIKQRRLELGYSYQDLADKTGISKSTLQRYETGYIKNLSIDKLEILANALHIDPAFLMGWEDASNIIASDSGMPEAVDELIYRKSNVLSRRFSSEYMNQAVDILTPFLVKKGYAVEFSERGMLGKIIASKDTQKWHLDFYLPYIDEAASKSNRLQVPSYPSLLQLYGKIVAYSESLTKYTIVVSNEYIMENILRKKPNNLSIESSIFLIDLKDKVVVKEIVF